MLFTKHNFINLKSIIILISIAWVNIAIASDDAYLDALEAEAESSNDIQSTKQVNKKFELEKITKNKQKIEFESRLSKELPASFKTYRMLSEDNKQVVITTYFDSNQNMPVATRALFNLYFKVK
ncbi:MAG: hypothetical protein DIZ80_03405 [endosymbiont of Galathealinum brachiosum]|uniref:Uncharacterized protein n=1 Tax=endosymbiont of Galathealinum brachiosum TaxID=2200906 RepID=A0A370DHZ6_9GAMM|nr:MAG: hypothetical protein DIZ80_03405 [endosymbiont of Galathealinum brachiosum]